MEPTEFARRLDGLDDLPSLPAIYQRIASLADDPSASATRFGEIISSDPALSARLLRIVNSAVFGFPRRITTLTRAFVVLGFESLRQLVLMTSVVDLFGPRPDSPLDLVGFWDHALATALLAKGIAHTAGEGRTEEVFVGGLLHDLGKMAALEIDPAGYAGILERAAPGQLAAAEREALGSDHAEIGAHLLRAWSLPAELVDLVAHHHHPSAAGGLARPAAAIQVADALAVGLGWGSAGQRAVPPLEPDALDRLAIGPAELADVLEAADREFRDSRVLFRPPNAT